MLSTDSTASAAPAAPSMCPVMPLVDVTAMRSANSPNTARTAKHSAVSPIGVDVACMLMVSTSARLNPPSSSAASIARRAPMPSGCGAVIWYASHAAPTPSNSAYTRAPRCSALSNASSRRVAAPSPATNPSRAASNGRLAAVGFSLFVDSARAAAKPPTPNGVMTASDPPAMMMSARPARIASSALIKLSLPVAHADTTA